MDLPAIQGRVLRLQIGEALPFAREQTSAINKSQVEQVAVTTLGFNGDEQADQFFHGGQLQAVHQMPLRVYDLIGQAFPGVVVHEGMLGENLIVSGMHEATVCVGDVFDINGVQLQITRPRRPCWKIDSQLGRSGVAKFLQEQGCVGWYYQVLRTGDIRRHDDCRLLRRPYPFATLARLWQIYNDSDFRDAGEIQRWLAVEPLERSFKEALGQRLTR